MEILFLDQNKWIDLAKAHSGKEASEPLIETHRHLLSLLNRGELIVPLTSANIIETSKRNDSTSRLDLAKTQAEFSKGLVFRSRRIRLEVEIQNALRKLFGYEPVSLPPNWVIVPNFIRAFDESELSLTAMAALTDKYSDPKEIYLDFMRHQDDQVRRQAHVNYLQESTSLVKRIQTRRLLFANYGKDLRQRAYSVNLFLEHQNLIIKSLVGLGHTFYEMEELGSDVFINFFENIPTLNVEVKLAVGREAQTGILKTNDLGDFENFSTATPYSTIIVAEKNFVALAKQTKLDEVYNIKLYTKLEDFFISR